MATRYGIDKLRQGSIFQPTPDITGGGMDIGGYGAPPPTFEDPFQSPGLPDYGDTPVNAYGGDNPLRFNQNVKMGPPPPIRPQSYSTDDIADLVNKFYTPSTVDRDRNRGLLDSAPVRQDPGFLGKLAGAGAYLGNKSRGIAGGLEAQEKAMYAPYYREMADWTAKTTPFHQAASLENTANINERTLAGNMVNATTTAARNDATARAADERNRIAQQKADQSYETTMFRERTRRFLAENPDWEVDYSGPTVKVFNPQTHQIVDMNIETGKVDELTRLEIQGKYRVAAAQQTGANAQNLEATRQAGRPFQINGKTYVLTPDGAVEVSGLPEGTMTRPGTPSTTQPRTDNESEIKLRQARIANEIIARNPLLAPYIKVVNGVVQVKAPSAGMFSGLPGKLREDYENAVESIYSNKPSGGMAPSPNVVQRGVNRGANPAGNTADEQTMNPNRIDELSSMNKGRQAERNERTGVFRRPNATGTAYEYSQDNGKTWTPNDPSVVPKRGGK